MEEADDITDTEELCVEDGGEEQKFCVLLCPQAKDLFHVSRPNSA